MFLAVDSKLRINNLSPQIIVKSDKYCSCNQNTRQFALGCNASDKVDLSASLAAFLPQGDCAVVPKISFSGRYALSDANYRKALARGINGIFPDIKCASEDLQSIIGPQELEKALKKAKPENFSVGGPDMQNVKNGVFRFNLHNHTTDSDGKFTVEEFLDASARYADSIKKPVYVAITNHDSTNDLVKAVKIVAQNKDNYKNVRLVLGVEFNAKYENSDMFKKPLQLEMLGYCVNPFDKRFSHFIKKNKTTNRLIAKGIIKDVNEKYGTKIKFSDVKDCDSSIKNCGSPSFLKQFKKALASKIELAGHSQEHLENIFKAQVVKHGDIKITDATPSMKDIIDVVNQTSGFVGIAHPVRNSMGSKINLSTRNDREAHYGELFMRFFQDFKEMGGKSIEANYQYNPAWHLRHPFKMKKIEMVQDIQKQLKLLGASGLDCHQKSIFKNE